MEPSGEWRVRTMRNVSGSEAVNGLVRLKVDSRLWPWDPRRNFTIHSRSLAVALPRKKARSRLRGRRARRRRARRSRACGAGQCALTARPSFTYVWTWACAIPRCRPILNPNHRVISESCAGRISLSLFLISYRSPCDLWSSVVRHLAVQVSDSAFIKVTCASSAGLVQRMTR